MTKPGFLRLASLGALLLAFAMQVALAEQRFTREVNFDIAAQSVEAALIEFSKQADVQVMVGGALKGQKTGGVKGKLSVTDALQQLLRDTGLDYQTEGNNTITIRSSASVRSGAQVLPLVREAKLASRDAAGEAATRDRTSADEPITSSAETLAEVVVTGTLLRGVPPTGRRLIVIGREEIDRTAHTTVQEIVQDLPQNFKGGGANEGTGLGGGPVNINTSFGSSINLRGFGPGSTLVLINGRRPPPAGIDASYVDVSSIPASAIDRIEVLLDGASATYGADAVGGVVNIILKQDYEGAETDASRGIPTQGGAEEFRIAQALGTTWDGGHVLATYEYTQRNSLHARDRRATRDQDLRSRGGSDFRSITGNPGTIVVDDQTWAIPSGQDGIGLTEDDFAGLEGTRNRYNQNEMTDVLPEQKRHSFFGQIGQQAGSRLKFDADILFAQRDARGEGGGFSSEITVPSTNPYYVNPTGGTDDIAVDYNFGRDLGPLTADLDVTTVFGGVGMELSMPAQWVGSVRIDYGREKVDQLQFNEPIAGALDAALADDDPNTAFNPFGDGSNSNRSTLARIRGSTTFESDSRVETATLGATGPLMSLPAGDLSLAAGLEYRDQQFDTTTQDEAGGDTFTTVEADRDVRAAFVEMRLPVFGHANARTAMRRLDFSAAARYERYSDFGSATSPAFGLAWSPVDDLTLRVSKSKAFKAPTLPSLDGSGNLLFITNLPDPQSQTGFSSALLLIGTGNPELDAEHSDAWTIGLDWAPAAWPGVQAALNYFDIEFEDRIQSFATQAFTFLQDPRFADAIIRDPSSEQRAAACASGQFFGLQPSDCIDAPVAALLDVRPRNTAISNQKGLDFLTQYSTTTSAGTFSFALNTTYLLSYEESISRVAPQVELLNRPFQPVDLKLRGSVYWTRGSWGLGSTIHFTDSYSDPLSVTNRAISSWTSVDFQLRYQPGRESFSWLAGLTAALNVENAFDREPPFYENARGVAYDATNSDLMGRVVSLQVRKEWGRRAQ